ncbi:MAG TPA: hypothetical protein PKY50_19425, partial [Candidatus Competibacter sp.]|nr:hypothetical protein [Candidatus Competibacter sp.]
SLLFATLRQLAPSRRRVWAVFDPAYDGWLMELARPAAVALGLRLELREAGDLRASVREFRRILEDADPKTDALWLLADTRIIDSETVLPLVIEKGWQRRLPVFSNSLQHIRRGVLFALYPDNLLLGRRLAELAGRAPGALGRIETLRAVKRALNLKAAAHLDLPVDREVERQFDPVLPVW